MTDLALQNIPAPLPALIDGWIDFGLRHGDAPPRADPEGLRRGVLNEDGLALRFDPAKVICGVRGELFIASLGSPRFRPEDAPRGEQVLDGWAEAYRRRHADAAKGVAGAYAVFIADFRARRALLACDRFARETLCYAHEGGRLLFSDRADALARRCNADFDPQAIYNYLWFHFIPAPQTLFRGVRRLLGAETATLEDGRLALHRHWVPGFEESRRASFKALKEEFRELVRRAVAREAADARVGCFLSGGTDSSTIAGMLGRVTGERARSYSIGFAVTGYDETAYARIAAQHFDCRHHEHYLTADELVAAIPKVAAAYDQPFGNSSTLPAYYCAAIARKDGVEKMLGGDGGDELFGGNSRYAVQWTLDLYRHVPSSLRTMFDRALHHPRAVRLALFDKARRAHEYASAPVPDRLERYNLLRRLGADEGLDAVWLEKIERDQPAELQRRLYEATPAGALINRMLAYDWKYTLADNDLRKVITTCTLAGVQAAFPLIDDELVDFSLKLPAHYKLRGRQLRWFFKQALKDFLPPEIIRKKKHGFGLPFGRWLTEHPALHELAYGSLQSLRARGWVRPEFIDQLFRSRLQEHPGYYGEMVWILMMLELWMRAPQPAPAAPEPRPQLPAMA